MDGLKQFVDSAREKGWNDGHIKEALLNNGWDAAQVDTALGGLDVPVPVPMAPAHGGYAHEAGHRPGPHKPERPTISALQAALQHVLLWLFTLMSSIMISVVAFTLFDNSSAGSSDTLLTYLVLELVTFAPFAFFYWQYLRQLGKQPELMTGKVWSIITIVLHSVGLIGSVISFILVIILVNGGETTAGLVSSGTIGAMDALVVAAYVWANFAKDTKSQARTWYLRLFPIALFVLIGILGVMALVRVGPLRADDQTRQDLSSLVSDVRDYADDNKALPQSESDLSDVPDGVTYERLSTTEYEVCGTFKKGTDDSSYSYYNSTDDYDDYVSTYTFYGKDAGHNCWTFQNYNLVNN